MIQHVPTQISLDISRWILLWQVKNATHGIKCHDVQWYMEESRTENSAYKNERLDTILQKHAHMVLVLSH